MLGQLHAYTHPYHCPALICTSCPGHLVPFAITHLFVRFFNCIGTHLLLLVVVSPTQRGDPGHSSRSELFVGRMTEEAGEGAEEVGAARVWGSDRFGERSRLRPTSCVTSGRSLPGKPFPAGVSSSVVSSAVDGSDHLPSMSAKQVLSSLEKNGSLSCFVLFCVFNPAFSFYGKDTAEK